jgi:hypothetical protein
MQTAKSTLEAISADPGAQSLVREREMARRAHEHLLYSARIAGRTEGRAEGEAKSSLAVLDARGISVSEAQRQHRLGAWVRKAVTLTDVDELFRD